VTAPIRLDVNLDIRAAAPLRETLLAQADRPVALDAAQVARLGALCLQVLLAARRDWSERGLDFSIQDPSAAFTETVRLFGAQDALGPALTAGA
jgi:chemotaxis protein CheX